MSLGDPCSLVSTWDKSHCSWLKNPGLPEPWIISILAMARSSLLPLLLSPSSALVLKETCHEAALTRSWF